MDKELLRAEFIYLKRSSIGCKKFQKLLPKPFLVIFSLLRNFSLGQTFTSHERLFCPNWLKWNAPPLKGWPNTASKICKKCTPNNLLEVFTFLWNFNIGQTSASSNQSFCPNWLKLTLPTLKVWPFSQRKVSLLKKM